MTLSAVSPRLQYGFWSRGFGRRTVGGTRRREEARSESEAVLASCIFVLLVSVTFQARADHEVLVGRRVVAQEEIYGHVC